MKPRKHRNSKRRITAKERATAIAHQVFPFDEDSFAELRGVAQRALAAHARQALRRDDRRDGKVRP
jgi:hypothetical protein